MTTKYHQIYIEKRNYNSFKDILEERKLKVVVKQDKSLINCQERFIEILGPLTKLWNNLETLKGDPKKSLKREDTI